LKSKDMFQRYHRKKLNNKIGRRLSRLHLKKKSLSDAFLHFIDGKNYVDPIHSKAKTEHGPVSRKRRRCFEAGQFTGPAPVNHNIIKLYKLVFNVFARILRFFLKSGLAIKVLERAKIFIF
jgi:hypothetical protein